ncbi:MAG: cell division protein FtsW [Arenicella sp.]|jgi:cell division protein FtsW
MVESNIKNISKNLQGDKIIWAIVIVLSLFSILLVYSSTSALAYKSAGGDNERILLKHIFLILLGLGAMYICHKIDYRYYARLSRFALIASALLLIFALKFGMTVNEASRWILIPFVNQSFQPADLAKLALIVNLASMLSKRQNSIQDFQKAIVPMLIWCGVICGLIAMSDFSSGVLLFLTCGLIMFIGRVPFKYLGTLAVVGLIAGMLAFTFGQRGRTVSSRLEMYSSTDDKLPFHAQQSNIAIALGGFAGQGLGNSIQRNFLPHAYSDFIFAIVVEEYGFIGAVVIIGLYLLLLYRGMLIVGRSRGSFGALLASGLVFSLILQAFIHMAVVVGIVPITGLPLPLLSMGGTSLLFTGMTMGILVSVSRVGSTEDKVDLLKATIQKANYSAVRN